MYIYVALFLKKRTIRLQISLREKYLFIPFSIYFLFFIFVLILADNVIKY